jgi:hypothetical protein
MGVIRNSVPEQRVLNEILGSAASAPSRPAPQSAPPRQAAPYNNAANDLYDEVSNTKVSGYENTATAAPSAPSATNSLEDLYNDL